MTNIFSDEMLLRRNAFSAPQVRFIARRTAASKWQRRLLVSDIFNYGNAITLCSRKSKSDLEGGLQNKALDDSLKMRHVTERRLTVTLFSCDFSKLREAITDLKERCDSRKKKITDVFKKEGTITLVFFTALALVLETAFSTNMHQELSIINGKIISASAALYGLGAGLIKMLKHYQLKAERLGEEIHKVISRTVHTAPSSKNPNKQYIN